MGALSGLVFGAVMSLLFIPLLYLAGELKAGICLSLGCAVTFGGALGWFSLVASRRLRSKIPMRAGESLIHQGPANHFVDKEAVGGWLYLTNQRLLFASHGANFFVHKWEAPLSTIEGVRTCATLKVIPNGIVVSTTDGERRFAVDGRALWKNQIDTTLCIPLRD